ncbi:MAG TPA: MATE family efflux transporter [Vicinamibacterales bacterium]|jgi:putative MATE family efflux protein|nr:MATE family efflux transporter [Vicinamibacterales bacterium]
MQDLTTGSISKHLLATASFMLVTMVFQTLYFLVDLFCVGYLGKEAVAGVGVAGNLTFVVLAVTQMLAVGTTTLVSHAVGRKDEPRALLVFNQSQLLAMVAGLLFLVVSMATRIAYTQSLAADAATAQAAGDYLLYYLPAMALQFPMAGMAAALRGVGNFKPGMIVQTSTIIINIALAPLLIFGPFGLPRLGVAGAALATFIAVVVGTVWLSTYFFGREGYLRFHRPDLSPRFELWGAMLKIGLPAGAEFLMMGVYLMLVSALARPFGAEAQAGFVIGMRVVQALFMPVVALGFSVAPVAGQNVGARLGERVKTVFKDASLMAVGWMLLMAVLCEIAPAALIGIFSNDPGVIAVGNEYLRIVALTFALSGLIFVCSSMFQAMGNTMPSLIASVTRIVVIAVPAILLSTTPGFRLVWIWYLSAGAVVLQLAIVLLLLRREFRVRLGSLAATPVPTAVVSPEAL